LRGAAGAAQAPASACARYLPVCVKRGPHMRRVDKASIPTDLRKEGNTMITAKDIASMIDHSMLQPYMTNAEVGRGCEVALRYHTASVCARPDDMATVVRELKGSGIPACTVIGFPHGSVRADVKLYEAQRALDEGVEELDMVINIGRLRAGEDGYVRDDIAAIVNAAHSANAIVKVILENCFLTREEIERACRICCDVHADFVKTSTGYGKYGAKLRDLIVMRDSITPDVRIKAAGGIRTLDMALLCRHIGCSRCGASATEAIMQETLRREAEGTLIEKTAEELQAALAVETY
jgi:deoxyribose-phosphate aldolase